MELRHIRYFKAVAEEKNFTRAAEKLAIAQPPLSRQIQDLEAELGTSLFVRTPHKVTLTEEGELFLQYATQILDLVNRSEEEVKERKEGLQGTLYIASVEGCGPRLFAEWIAAFQKKHPHVQYNLWNGNTDDVNNRVTKGLCELAMITAPYNTEMDKLASGRLRFNIATQKPEMLEILDKDGNPSLRIVYQSFEGNKTFDEGLFQTTGQKEESQNSGS